MPHTMRSVYIRQVTGVTKSIIVNYDVPPASVEELCVTSIRESEKLRNKVRAIGNPGSVALRTRYDNRYPRKGSRYFERFH